MGCNRTALLIISAVLSGVCTVLLIAALARRNWFGTDMTASANVDQIGLSRDVATNFSVWIDPFTTTWNIVLTPDPDDPLLTPGTSKRIVYDGDLGGICDNPDIRSFINDDTLCTRINQAGKAVGAIAIVAVVLAGISVLLCLIAAFAKSCDNRCIVFLLALVIFIAFLADLVVAAAWGAVATFGKNQLNNQVPTFIKDQFEQHGSVTNIQQNGSFNAAVSLWLAVASVAFSFLSMLMNFASCCCGDSRKEKHRV